MIFVIVFGLTTSLIAMTLEERQQYWDKFSQVIPAVPSFTKWQQENNAQPPDFDALPKSAGLPDPLTFADGKRSTSNMTSARSRPSRRSTRSFRLMRRSRQRKRLPVAAGLDAADRPPDPPAHLDAAPPPDRPVSSAEAQPPDPPADLPAAA
jgi:hypothetical protein